MMLCFAPSAAFLAWFSLTNSAPKPHYLFVMVVVDFALLNLWLMRPTLVPGPRPTSCALTIGHFSIGM